MKIILKKIMLLSLILCITQKEIYLYTELTPNSEYTLVYSIKLSGKTEYFEKKNVVPKPKKRKPTVFSDASFYKVNIKVGAFKNDIFPIEANLIETSSSDLSETITLYGKKIKSELIVDSISPQYEHSKEFVQYVSSFVNYTNDRRKVEIGKHFQILDTIAPESHSKLNFEQRNETLFTLKSVENDICYFEIEEDFKNSSRTGFGNKVYQYGKGKGYMLYDKKKKVITERFMEQNIEFDGQDTNYFMEGHVTSTTLLKVEKN